MFDDIFIKYKKSKLEETLFVWLLGEMRTPSTTFERKFYLINTPLSLIIAIFGFFSHYDYALIMLQTLRSKDTLKNSNLQGCARRRNLKSIYYRSMNAMTRYKGMFTSNGLNATMEAPGCYDSTEIKTIFPYLDFKANYLVKKRFC